MSADGVLELGGVRVRGYLHTRDRVELRIDADGTDGTLRVEFDGFELTVEPGERSEFRSQRLSVRFVDNSS